MRWAIEATEPGGAQYVLRYTAADSEREAWALLQQTVARDQAAMLHPLATLRAVKGVVLQQDRSAASREGEG